MELDIKILYKRLGRDICGINDVPLLRMGFIWLNVLFKEVLVSGLCGYERWRRAQDIKDMHLLAAG